MAIYKFIAFIFKAFGVKFLKVIYNFSQLVKGGDISKTLDMKGRESAVRLVDVSSGNKYKKVSRAGNLILSKSYLAWLLHFSSGLSAKP